MGLAFNKVSGAAKKGGDYMKLEEGDNVFRMVGNVLPRYLYWVKNDDNKRLPFECLGFDRDLERFTNLEKDCIQDAGLKTDKGDDLRCSWSYAVQVIDRKDGKLKILNLKKKMFEALIKYCQDTEQDPTDIEKGFDVIVERVKTGTFAYNVDYTIKEVKMMKAGTSALSEEDRETIKDLKSIDEAIPRPTAADQKKAFDKFMSGSDSDESGTASESESTKEAISELDGIS